MRTNENETYVALNKDRIYLNQKRKTCSKYGQERIAVNVINIHYNEAMEVATSIASFRFLQPSQDMSESVKRAAPGHKSSWAEIFDSAHMSWVHEYLG